MPYVVPSPMFDDAQLLQCYGFGVIRAIDIERRLFYVLTPVDRATLTRVNVFARSSTIDLPTCFLFSQVLRMWLNPYIYYSCVRIYQHRHLMSFDHIQSVIFIRNWSFVVDICVRIDLNVNRKRLPLQINMWLRRWRAIANENENMKMYNGFPFRLTY